MEEWRDIPGWEGMYQASDHGRIRSLDRDIEAKGVSGGTRHYPGRIRKPHTGEFGHQFVSLFNARRETRRSVHSLVALAFLGPRPEGLYVCHNNGNASDNRPENLRYDTASANNYDMAKHGTQWQIRKTHCPRGHEYADWNIVPSQARRGGRKCLACSRAQSRVRYHPELADQIDEVADSYYKKLIEENN